jgi:hypothetical protein
VLLRIEDRGGKGEIHLFVADFQGFLGKGLFLLAGGHPGKLLGSLQWLLVDNCWLGRIRHLCGGRDEDDWLRPTSADEGEDRGAE